MQHICVLFTARPYPIHPRRPPSPFPQLCFNVVACYVFQFLAENGSLTYAVAWRWGFTKYVLGGSIVDLLNRTLLVPLYGFCWHPPPGAEVRARRQMWEEGRRNPEESWLDRLNWAYCVYVYEVVAGSRMIESVVPWIGEVLAIHSTATAKVGMRHSQRSLPPPAAYLLLTVCIYRLTTGQDTVMDPMLVVTLGLLSSGHSQLRTAAMVADREQVLERFVPNEVARALINERIRARTCGTCQGRSGDGRAPGSLSRTTTAHDMPTPFHSPTSPSGWVHAISADSGALSGRHDVRPSLATAIDEQVEVLTAQASMDQPDARDAAPAGPCRLVYYRQYDRVTVLFASIHGIDKLSAVEDATPALHLLHAFFARADDVMARHGLATLATVGDAYIACANLVEDDADHATSALRAAFDLAAVASWIDAPETIEEARPFPQGLSLLIGMHTGPVAAGVIGHTRNFLTLTGDTVNLASRMHSTCPAGFVHVTAETMALLPADVRDRFQRDTVWVKGKGDMETGAADAVFDESLRLALGTMAPRLPGSPPRRCHSAPALLGGRSVQDE